MSAEPAETAAARADGGAGDPCRGIRRLALGLAVAGAVALLAAMLGTDVHGAHLFRQAHVVSNIERMRAGGLFVLPTTYNLGMPDHVYDFPLYQGLVAALAEALGIRSVLAARLVGLAVFLATLTLLWRLLRLVEPRATVRSLALFLFAASPLQIWYASAPIPDAFACLLALVAVFGHERCIAHAAGVRHDTADRASAPHRVWFAVVLAASFLATLIKIPVILPSACVILSRGFCRQGSRALRSRWYLGFSLSVLAAVALYLVVALPANAHWRENHPDPVFGSRFYWYFSNFTDRLHAGYYRRVLLRYVAKQILDPVMASLALFALAQGLLARSQTPSAGARRVFGAWLAGSAISVIVFFNLHWRHNYYFLPHVVPLCYFAAVGGSDLLGRLAARPRLRCFTLVLLIAAHAVFAGKHLVRLERANSDYVARLVEAGEFLQRNTRTDDFVVYLVEHFDYQPEPLYFARRIGFTADARRFDRGLLERIRLRYSSRGRLRVFCPAAALPSLAPRAESLGLRPLAGGPAGSLFALTR